MQRERDSELKNPVCISFGVTRYGGTGLFIHQDAVLSFFFPCPVWNPCVASLASQLLAVVCVAMVLAPPRDNDQALRSWDFFASLSCQGCHSGLPRLVPRPKGFPARAAAACASACAMAPEVGQRAGVGGAPPCLAARECRRERLKLIFHFPCENAGLTSPPAAALVCYK